MANCSTSATQQPCITSSSYDSCKPWDISAQTRTNCYADMLQQETIAIAGVPINVHKLLGIHEQTRLVDLTGNGTAISGGDLPNYPASNAFSAMSSEWKSKQSGQDVITSSYIGYDFGVVKLPNGRNRYAIPANVRQHITSLKIKQGSDVNTRVSKVRVERSDDGQQWYGVAVIQLPNDDNLNPIYFKQSVPSRYWRLRPLTFAGGLCAGWCVQALELIDYSLTNSQNIQDPILLENRDRDYQTSPVRIKGYYDLQSPLSELMAVGMGINSTYMIKVNFNSCVSLINRPLVIGDIIELPNETQYTSDLRPVKKFLEVTDVTWDASSYTPGWMPTMLLVTAKPALASQETRDVFGDLSAHVDSSGLFDTNDGNNQMYQDYSQIDQTIKATANSEVPELGVEGSNTVREFSDEELAITTPKFPHINAMGFNRTGLYVEDALPQNGAPYTEGPVLPENASNGDYHRLTYEGTASDIPARLYRFSSSKQRWIYLETDRRQQYNVQKASLQEYIDHNPVKTAARTII